MIAFENVASPVQKKKQNNCIIIDHRKIIQCHIYYFCVDERNRTQRQLHTPLNAHKKRSHLISSILREFVERFVFKFLVIFGDVSPFPFLRLRPEVRFAFAEHLLKIFPGQFVGR